MNTYNVVVEVNGTEKSVTATGASRREATINAMKKIAGDSYNELSGFGHDILRGDDGYYAVAINAKTELVAA